ncbi:TPA: hypothetical protein EYP38_00005, partial [Candidatus Micrarchaeota archaeon]|nr:hypothetical protein [Candidatus Micrarchaeota archaeon]
MKLILFGLLLGLLFFGCTSPGAPEAEAPAMADETSTPEQPPEEEPEEVESTGPVTGEGTILEVGESIPATGDAESIISESELSAHHTAASCRVLYEGKVYDVTAYLNKHPGGPDTITWLCGATDSSFADA